MKSISHPLGIGNLIRSKRRHIRHCSVFVVDDSKYDLHLMKRYLNLFPNRSLDNSVQLIVEGYANASECLKEIYRKPDIVVLDYYLDTEDQHSLNGLELMREIHDKSPDTQVIIVSGQQNAKITAELIKYGAFSYIAKDQYYERQLQEIITEMLKMDRLAPEWTHIRAKRVIYLIYGLALYSLIVYCLIRICS